MNVLQWHRIHTPSLFWSVTHHNLPVLFESCILYLHRCTCFAQTPQIKRSTGSYMSCSARITVRVQTVPELDKNKAQICCSERTYGTGIMLDRPLPFKLHQSYRPLPRYIQEINPAVKSGYQSINTVMHGSRSFGALHWAAAFSFNCSVL